eukprot:387090-Prorocentrum_minimum.AAC.1
MIGASTAAWREGEAASSKQLTFGNITARAAVREPRLPTCVLLLDVREGKRQLRTCYKSW